jgi:DNA mismatch repair protein MutS
MATISEYFEYQKLYQEKYGHRTVVLIQIGSFYEIYEYNPDQDDSNDCRYTERIGYSRELSIILNMILTSKTKNKSHRVSNPYMIGFPCLAYERHREVILANNYTLIRIDQSPDNPKNRIVGEICSAGTELDSMSEKATNSIVSIYIECQNIKGVKGVKDVKGVKGAKMDNVDDNTKRNENVGVDDYVIISGMSSIDVTTGENIVCEVYSQDGNNIYALQEIYRFLASQQPREVLVHIRASSLKIENAHLDKYIDVIYDLLELNKYTVIGPKIDQIEKEYLTINYQNQLLNRIFPSSSNGLSSSNSSSLDSDPDSSSLNSQSQIPITAIERLDLERLSYGLISYIVLLQYCYEHNETLIQRLHRPKTSWTDQSKHLILANNAIHQLDIIPNNSNISTSANSNRGRKRIDSLLSVLDNTNTPMGKRMLRKMLLSPITDMDRLDILYGVTDELISNNDILKTTKSSLQSIPDLDRLSRKIRIEKISPRELSLLYYSYIKIVALYCNLFGFAYDSNTCQVQQPFLMKLFPSNSVITPFNQWISYINSTIDIDKLNQCKLLEGKAESRMDSGESFLRKGIDPLLDQLDQNITMCKERLESICDHLNGLLSASNVRHITPDYGRKTKSTPSIEKYDDINVSIITTAARATLLKRKISQVDIDLCGNLEFNKVTKGMIITSDKIREFSICLEQSRSMLEIHSYQMYKGILNKLSSEFNFYTDISDFVSTLDYVKTNAYNAIMFGYNRPDINRSSDHSFLSVKKARHPIIERIISSEYIHNDLDLGNGESNNYLGMLLYGVNSSGKSSLTKSIGLIIIMAQAGMFVPAELTYKPYNRITTRLSGNDDIFKGQSSFVVEMTELRNILKNASPSTLVLGDELCRGTESISGTSLTVATLETLIEAKSSFIFSTHMHHLSTYPSIVELSSEMRVCHLSTYYDEEIKDLVYDRKLEEGSGSSVYGLEVCRSLSMDPAFIDKANKVRHNLSKTPSLLKPKKSNYNASVYVDRCSLCGSVDEQIDTHHVKEQHMADEHGFIGTFHKNSTFNLIALCSDCHSKLHANNMKLVPKQTLTGIQYNLASEETEN